MTENLLEVLPDLCTTCHGYQPAKYYTLERCPEVNTAIYPICLFYKTKEEAYVAAREFAKQRGDDDIEEPEEVEFELDDLKSVSYNHWNYGYMCTKTDFHIMNFI